jgi:hypothetical protein
MANWPPSPPVPTSSSTRSTLAVKPTLNSIRKLFRRAPWPQLEFLNSSFEIIGDEYLLEEETLEHFSREAFSSVHLGEAFASRYQVVGKPGFGVISIVWLTRDPPVSHVTKSPMPTYWLNAEIEHMQHLSVVKVSERLQRV